jgi:glycine betaine/proline transport system substrate-binding protein
VFLAQLDAAITKKQPILFYYWEPEWIFAVFDLRKLEEPPFNGYTTDDYKGTPNYNKAGCYTFYQPNVASDWLEKSSITCDQPPTHVYIGHSKELANRAPDISKFLKQVTLDGDTVNQWILAIDREKKPPEDVARAWVEANKAKVEGEWLKDVPHTN